MKIIKLNLGKRSYDIIIGDNAIKYLAGRLIKLNIGRDAYIITNALVNKKHGAKLKDALRKAGFNAKFKVVPDTEKSKSLAQVSLVINDIARFDNKKRSFIIAFGGGVIGALAGFVASIYKRGVAYIQVPTTLLAQVDSGIGGKTAVDLAEAKDLIGAVIQPKLVLSDVRVLNTLNIRQIRCGFAEVIKYAIIKDAQLFSYLEKKHKDILNLKPQTLEYIINRCSEIKARIVEIDEREEKGARTILNFGHTVGHAIEAAAGYEAYNHGEAICLGMLVAADIRRRLGLMDIFLLRRIEELVKKTGLPARIKHVPINSILNAHSRDKKFIGKRNRFVLIGGLGKTRIVENIPLEVIRQAIAKRIF